MATRAPCRDQPHGRCPVGVSRTPPLGICVEQCAQGTSPEAAAGSAEIARTFIGLPLSRGIAERRGSTRSGPGPGALSSRASMPGATAGGYGHGAVVTARFGALGDHEGWALAPDTFSVLGHRRG